MKIGIKIAEFLTGKYMLGITGMLFNVFLSALWMCGF